MMKREIDLSDAASAAEGSRPKRRKEGVDTPADMDASMGAIGPNEMDEGGQGEPESVKEQGLRLWQIVKDAVNKEGRTLSIEFLKKPPKRLYPDYYKIIQKPIALEDIKKQLDHNAYHTLEEVRVDFELCFTNAKTYNMKESEIWKDAKDLLKLVNKTYEKMVPSAADAENADGGSGDKGKSKTPSMYRTIKSRLQRLVDKADDSGRILSTEFMELPSKKEWPLYYKEIKRPQCLENIFKHIKRKEYPSVAEFATDVELVFSNALTFNQEHTLIWEDARVLRDYFRQVMSDLPPPFALPEYSKPAPTKIKIKPQAAQSSAAVATSVEAQGSSTPNITLRVPALGAANAAKAPAQPAAAVPAASTSSSLLHSAPQPAATPQKQAKAPLATPQPVTQSTQNTSQATGSYSHYPKALYHASTGAPATPALASQVKQSQSPTPSVTSGHQLKHVALCIQPHNRKLYLDHRDGVKSWAMRLSPAETGVLVEDVAFFHDEEEESSGDEEAEQEPKQEEEEEEVEEAPVKNGRRKGKSRAKTRSQKSLTKSSASKSKVPVPKKKATKIGEVQVKLDGTAVKDEKVNQWTASLSVGSHVLEIGEVGGIHWKVYAERLGEA